MDSTKKMFESIIEAGKPKTQSFDTTAEVTRVENGTAWVHIPGGVRETPVKLTINAKAGDTVQVRVSGGRAFMVGNASAPPTDNTVANHALKETRVVSKAAKTAQDAAEKALNSAKSKSKNIYKPKPAVWPTEGYSVGDTWWATDEGYKMYRFNGTTWEEALLDTDAFAAGCIKAGLIDAGAVTADKINADAYTGRTFTGSTLQTTQGALRAFLQRQDGTIYATTPADPNYAFVKIMNQGVQAINPNNLSNVYAQFLHGFFSDVEGENFYGFYITPALFSRKLFTDHGPVLSKYENLDYETATQAITAVNGVTGLIRRNIGIVTLKFEYFSFAANTATDSEDYALNTDFAPLTDLDFVSTHNGVRFRITSGGFIQPYTKPTAATAIRGSFTYMVAGGSSVVG